VFRKVELIITTFHQQIPSPPNICFNHLSTLTELIIVFKMALQNDHKIQDAEVSTGTTQVQSVRDSDKAKPYIPLAGVANDGWNKDDEATATCFCGAVQLAFVSCSPEFQAS
jgi:hypothetical protein